MLAMQYPVVILADGDFPSHAIPLRALEQAETIVCCDGAAEKLLMHNMNPSYIVGDLDSLPDATRMRFSDRIICETSQEINDLTKAVEFCLKQGVQKLAIVGATGLREDHTIANISLLANYAKKCEIELITDYGIFSAISAATTFESFAGQQVSIFSLMPETPVSLDGLKYPLTNYCLDSWWKGTLNEAIGNRFTISFEKGEIIIFRVF